MSRGLPDDNFILNSVSDGISINTGEIFVYINKPNAELLGYTVDELLGTSITNITAPEYLEMVKERTRRRQTGLPVPSKYELELIKKDGSRIPVEFSVSHITYKGKSSSLTIVRDISYRRESEAMFRETEKRYQILFNSTGEAILVHSEGKFIEANDAAVRLLGYSRQEFREIGPIDISFDKDPERFKNVIQTITQDGRRVREGNLVRKDGVVLDVFITSQILDYQDSKAILSVIFDITERNAYERNLHVLHSHASRLATAADIPSIYQLTREAIQETIKADRVALGFVYPTELVYEYFSDLDDDPIHIPLDSNSISTRVIKSGVSEIVDNVNMDPDFLNLFPDVQELTRSELIVPVKLGSNVLAVINLGNHTSHSFTINDLKLVETLAEHVASSINRIKQSKQIKESELQLRHFLESASDGFTIIDQNLIVVNANTSWLEQAGKKRDEVIGRRFDEIFPYILETPRYEAYKRVMKTGVPEYFPGVGAASGNGLYLDVSAFKSGEYLGIVTRDVTESIKYQNNLEMLHANAASLSSAESFTDIVSITQQSITKVLGKDFSTIGLIEGENLVYSHLWGNPDGGQLILPLDGPGLSVKAIKEGRSIRVEDLRDNELYVESTGNVKSQSELDVPLFMEGKVVGVINLESDVIAEFSENDQKLVEILASHISASMSRIEYNDRLDALHSMTLELGYTQNIKQIGEVTMRIMRDVLGFQFSSIFMIEDNALVTYDTSGSPLIDFRLPLDGKGITVRSVLNKETILVEDTSQDPDFVKGPTASKSELVVPIILDDEAIGVLNVESSQLNSFSNQDARLMETLAQNVGSAIFRIRVEDERKEMERKLMLERIRTEQEQELNQMKTRFMSTATHEIRTPLASIQGYVEIIRDVEGDLNENQRTYFDVIHRNVQRLTVLTNDLLDLQRLDEDRIELILSSTSVSDLVNDLSEEFSPILAEKNQTLEIDAYDGEWVMDRLRVMQVLINLISNASKFSPVNSVIQVIIEKEKGQLQFQVKDQGIGLIAEDLEKLFDPFPGILVKGNSDGTGLGLSICKGIIGLHNGEIWAESEGEGQGTIIGFTLPEA